MSNRLLAILILLWFGGAIYAFYLYFYVYYKWNLEITSNLDTYNITLYSDTVKRSFSKTCDSSKCLFTWLPPVEYTLTASASGYTKLQQDITIPKNSTAITAIQLKKEILLEPISQFVPRLDPKEKVEKFTSRKLYKLIDNEAWVYYVTKKNNRIYIEDENRNIWDFDFTGTKRDIRVEKVMWDSDTIFLHIQDTNSLYHKKYQQFSEIWIEDITYIKKYSPYTFLIVTPEQIYEYTPNTNSISKSEIWDDFITYGDDIYTLMQKKSQYLLQKNQKTILETSINIEKIFIENGNIYLSDASKNTYQLTGIE